MGTALAADPGEVLRPYLKWAGGKRQLWPEIQKHIPQKIHSYHEPFAGAGAVFFALRPPRAVINDTNTQLMASYRVIKEEVEELIALLKEHAALNSSAHYYRIRNLDRDEARFNQLSAAEKAARLIFLNRTCFNGLYRVNARGFFNVPPGRYKNPAICEEDLLRRISRYLNASHITMLNTDFEAAVASAKASSFVYFDPPYHSPGKTNFTAYQAGGFGEAEQERLAEFDGFRLYAYLQIGCVGDFYFIAASLYEQGR